MIPFNKPLNTQKNAISAEAMEKVNEILQTPYKYGGVINHGEEMADCITIFRKNDFWYMMYTGIDNRDEFGKGYDTYYAKSSDLLHWEKMGKALSRGGNDWDSHQIAGGFALLDNEWESANHEIEKYDGKYWCSYLGGNLVGYEPDPLNIGLAWTNDPTSYKQWNKLGGNILRMDDIDCREKEKCTLYKSDIFHDKTNTLGWPYVMFYNAKHTDNTERIFMAVSNNMTKWERYGDKEIIDNTDIKGNYISGDPQVVLMHDICGYKNLWVMNYFIHTPKVNTYDTFACSNDLINWTKWTGKPTVEPSEPWDNLFAHKPFLIKHNGIVYHYYCTCNDKGERFIALATSKKLL